MPGDGSVPRVVIGASMAERVPARVCESSIRACRSGRPVDVVHTHDLNLPRWSGRMGTAFSFVRWWVPELCGHQGRAIYLDSDMILFADIQELWDVPMGSRAVLSTQDPSVLVLDCAALEWRMTDILAQLAAGTLTYAQLFETYNKLDSKRIGWLPPAWNHIDQFFELSTKILHYSAIPDQPWRRVGHPLGGLWYTAFAEALRSGNVPLEWTKDLPTAVVEKAFEHAPARTN